MAWFALHPPDGVRLVPFFITSRLPAHGDRAGFIRVVIQQLAEILAEPSPVDLSPATLDAEFLDLLERAAQRCDDSGERLVLLVDGLDEDRGVMIGQNAYSIAALLPDHLQSGMRVSWRGGGIQRSRMTSMMTTHCVTRPLPGSSRLPRPPGSSGTP